MNGLVLAGGDSSRMGQNKGLISYFNQSQINHCHKLLNPFCKQTYLSVKDKFDTELPLIYDNIKYHNLGPLAGLISAFDFEDADWLVLAIDYPVIEYAELNNLILNSNELGAVYYNEATKFFEPFIAIYTSKFKSIILYSILNQETSLQKILSKSEIAKLKIEDESKFININTKEEYNQFMKQWIS